MQRTYPAEHRARHIDRSSRRLMVAADETATAARAERHPSASTGGPGMRACVRVRPCRCWWFTSLHAGPCPARRRVLARTYIHTQGYKLTRARVVCSGRGHAFTTRARRGGVRRQGYKRKRRLTSHRTATVAVAARPCRSSTPPLPEYVYAAPTRTTYGRHARASLLGLLPIAIYNS